MPSQREQNEIDAGYIQGLCSLSPYHDPYRFLECPTEETSLSVAQQDRANIDVDCEFEKKIAYDPLWGLDKSTPMAEFVAVVAAEPRRRDYFEMSFDEQKDFLSRGVKKKSERIEKVIAARREWISRRGCCGGVCGIGGACHAVPGGICPLISIEKVNKLMSELISIDDKIKEARLMITKATGEIQRTIAIAQGIAAVKEAIKPNVKDIMGIQNNALGFLTDSKAGYPEETVLNVMVEGLIRGFSMTGNEINIISGRFYGAKAGYRRLVERYPGLTNLDINLEAPVIKGDLALVNGYATWRLDGKPMRKQFDPSGKDGFSIPVRVNNGMGADGILGKAERKVLAKILVMVSGIPCGDAEDDIDPNTVDGTATITKQEALPAPALSEADQKVVNEMQFDIDTATTTASLTVLFKAVEKHHPNLVELLKPKFTAKKEALNQKALAS